MKLSEDHFLGQSDTSYLDLFYVILVRKFTIFWFRYPSGFLGLLQFFSLKYYWLLPVENVDFWAVIYLIFFSVKSLSHCSWSPHSFIKLFICSWSCFSLKLNRHVIFFSCYTPPKATVWLTKSSLRPTRWWVFIHHTKLLFARKTSLILYFSWSGISNINSCPTLFREPIIACISNKILQF